jgi:hypothetical protein
VRQVRSTAARGPDYGAARPPAGLLRVAFCRAEPTENIELGAKMNQTNIHLLRYSRSGFAYYELFTRIYSIHVFHSYPCYADSLISSIVGNEG